MNHWDLMQEGNFKGTFEECPDNLYIKMLNWQPPIDQLKAKKIKKVSKVTSASLRQLPEDLRLLD